MPGSTSQSLDEVVSAILDEPILGRLIQFEPRTELVAYVNRNKDVCIARIGGQRTATITGSQLDGSPTCIQWHVGGRSLRIGTDTGAVHDVNTESGKLVSSRLSNSLREEPVPVTCLGSAVNSAIALDQNGSSKISDIDQWLARLQLSSEGNSSGRQKDAELAVAMTNLPQLLAVLDVESTLPKLSPIATTSKQIPGRPTKQTGNSDMAFKLVSTSTRQDNMSLEIDLIADNDELLSIETDDVFKHDMPLRTPQSSINRSPIKHCANPRSSHHAILKAHQRSHLSPSNQEVLSFTNLELSIFQLPFSVTGGQHSPMILSKTAQLHGLGMYLSSCIDNMVSEWTSHSALPTRFIENISEELTEKNEGDLRSQLYKLAMTGHCSPTVTEWLKDILQERGHKRWDAAMTSIYGNVGQALQLHLSPALERCTLVASQLRGIAKYYSGSQQFDVPYELFTSILEAVTCAQVLAHEATRILSQEARLYRVFSKWLRRHIDMANMEPGSTGAIEAAESEASSTDMASLLEYLEGPMTNSGLKRMMHDQSRSDKQNTTPCLESISSQLRAARAGSADQPEHLSLPSCIHAVVRCIEVALERIQLWQDAIWKSPNTVTIADAVSFPTYDMRLFVRGGVDKEAYVMLVANGEGSTELTLHLIELERFESENGVKQTRKQLTLGDDVTVQDIAILSTAAILLLVRRGIRWSLSLVTEWSEDTEDLQSSQNVRTIHVFPSSANFVPGQIRVSENTHKRKVLVVDASQRLWKVLDMRHGS